MRALADELDAVVEWSDVLRRYLLVSPDFTMTLNWNHLAPVERAERFTGAWDGTWFEEDYCEGPGQALIVTPRGEVKPCCGFASDLDQLTIGNIYRDTVAEIVERARSHPYVGKVFREGLTAIRDEIMARDPAALPGATSNQCYLLLVHPDGVAWHREWGAAAGRSGTGRGRGQITRGSCCRLGCRFEVRTRGDSRRQGGDGGSTAGGVGVDGVEQGEGGSGVADRAMSDRVVAELRHWG